jgi:hemerythrin-like domain-containing protein
MNDPMRILKADHREVERLLKQLADIDEGSERKRLAKDVAAKLTAHMDIEESIVYPPVASQVGEEDREEAEIEHRLARQGLDTMMSMVDQPGFGAAVQMLLGGIGHHVEEEETQLLPELKDAMERDEWLALGDAIADAKLAAGLPLPDAPRRRSSKRRGRSTGTARTAESKARRGTTKKSTAAKKSSATKSSSTSPTARRSSASKR